MGVTYVYEHISRLMDFVGIFFLLLLFSYALFSARTVTTNFCPHIYRCEHRIFSHWERLLSVHMQWIWRLNIFVGIANIHHARRKHFLGSPSVIPSPTASHQWVFYHLEWWQKSRHTLILGSYWHGTHTRLQNSTCCSHKVCIGKIREKNSCWMVSVVG